jgi:hypothetical protein
MVRRSERAPAGRVRDVRRDGVRQPLAGTRRRRLRYLKEYDPWVSEIDERGELALARIVTTANPAEAMRFADVAAVRREWMRWDGWVRSDGRPSRPLTAFSIELAGRRGA